MFSYLEDLHERVLARIRRQHELRRATVFADRPGRGLQQPTSAEGLAIGVGLPYVVLADLDLPGPTLDVIHVKIRITENTVTNATGVTAVAAGELIARDLHQWLPGPSWVVVPVTLRAEFAWDELADRTGSEHRLTLTFETGGTLPTLSTN